MPLTWRWKLQTGSALDLSLPCALVETDHRVLWIGLFGIEAPSILGTHHMSLRQSVVAAKLAVEDFELRADDRAHRFEARDVDGRETRVRQGTKSFLRRFYHL